MKGASPEALKGANDRPVMNFPLARRSLLHACVALHPERLLSRVGMVPGDSRAPHPPFGGHNNE